MGVVRTLKATVRFRRPKWRASERRLDRIINVDDARRLAARRLPRGVFDYIDGGAEAEVSLGRNVSAFRDIEFVPRILRDVAHVDASANVLGQLRSLPLILSPTGFTRMVSSPGELAVARAAARVGIPYTLSSLATRSIEEIREVSDGDLWFQVYVWKDKELLASLLERAAAAKYSTIMITVDTAVFGRRERDVRRGFTLPPKLGMGTIFDGFVHPAWTLDFVNSEPIRFANVVGESVGDGSEAVALADWVNSQFDPGLKWGDVAWFRDRWEGHIVLKGIQSVPDAVIAKEVGVDAIALSNHGGRQLDGSPPPIELVAPVRDAVGDGLEIYCDGGIRRGSDLVKAVALGATAGMTGRAYLYGLAAAGEPGVEKVLGLLNADLLRCMQLVGCNSIDELGPEMVKRATFPV